MNIFARERTVTLPLGWRWLKLGDVSDLNPRRPIICRDDHQPTTFIPMSAVDDAKGAIKNPEQRPYSEVRKGYTYLVERDVLFAKITPCMENGKHAIARGLRGGFGFGSTEFHVIRPKAEICSEWIHFFIRQPDLLHLAKRNLTGAVGQQRVPESFLFNLEIPIPPLAEQKRIAAILKVQLGTIDKVRAAAEAQLEGVKVLRDALYRDVFGNVPPLSTNRNPDKSDQGWKWRLLKEIARLESGHTPSRYHPEWWGGDIPWLALPDIRRVDGRYTYDTSEHTNSDGIGNSSARILPAGTVCLSRTASVGYVTILGRPMATSQDFVNWVCGPELNPDFLMHLFLYSRNHFISLSSGAIHKTVYMPTVKRLSVLIPNIAEQQRIAASLNEQMVSTERLRAVIERQIQEMASLPSALLRKAFSGEL